MEERAIITCGGDYFNIEDTLECGQVFRFRPYREGYLVFSADKCAYARETGGGVTVECAANDREYFENYFDLKRDYSAICSAAEASGYPILKTAAAAGKGIRILNQNREEALFSFIISQNNNIPRIKGIIERICRALGERREFFGEEYYTFPRAAIMAEKGAEFYAGLGLGYRAGYIAELAGRIAGTDYFDRLSSLSTAELRKSLMSIKGVGAKVADCAVLFGFHRADSFPADTWIEKVYLEDFHGTPCARDKISERFVKEFGDNAGYFQQYLFYYKRSKEKALAAAQTDEKAAGKEN